MDFELLQLFVDICDLGSFSKAAARHIVSQSAVSQRIAQLERRLNQSLFDRKARPLTLTPAGQIVYDSARQLLAIHAQMQAHLEDLQPMSRAGAPGLHIQPGAGAAAPDAAAVPARRGVGRTRM